MTNIISFDGFDNNEIRVTVDGRYSVYDVIRFCGKKNPRDAWNRLKNEYSEVVEKVSLHKFPGRGQRETPITDRETIEAILRLLSAHPEQSPVTSNTFYPRTETQIVAVLSAAFADLSPLSQFSVHGYRIDLFLADALIAIEIDEDGHKHYDSERELKRESLIKSALGCSFVRVNPYAADFNLGDVILEVRGLVG